VALPFGSALARRVGAVRFFLFMAVTAAASAILGDRVVKANPFLAKMAAGDLAAWADRKMGGNAALMSIAGPASSPAASNLATAATPMQPQPTPQREATHSQNNINLATILDLYSRKIVG
jgi:hypothetical protein